MAMWLERSDDAIELVFEIVEQTITTCELTCVALLLELTAHGDEASRPEVCAL